MFNLPGWQQTLDRAPAVVRLRKMLLLRLTCSLLLSVLLAAIPADANSTVQYQKRTIRYIHESYRVYNKQDTNKPWHNGYDTITKRGHNMVAVLAPVVKQQIDTPLGKVGLAANPDFILQDFYKAYKVPTMWPYCENAKKCPVYVQKDTPAMQKAPMILTLPPGTSAVDFYIDYAIDCEKTLRATVKCKVVVQPGNVEVKVQYKSICASPFVGKYLGFIDQSGDSIDSVQIKCKSDAGPFPSALGLVRIGRKLKGQDPPNT